MLECLYETMLSIIILMDHFAPTLIGLGWFIPPNDHVFGMACIWQCVEMFPQRFPPTQAWAVVCSFPVNIIAGMLYCRRIALVLAE